MRDYSQAAHDLSIAAIQAQLIKNEIELRPDILATTYHDYYHDFLLELNRNAQEE